MGTIATHGVIRMSATEQLLKAQMVHTIVILEGALIAENEEDTTIVGQLTGLGLNLATLPQESLYQLQDSTMMELRARERHVEQVLSKQRINIEQLTLQWDEAVAQSQQVEQVVREACSHAPKLEIATDSPVGIRIHKLASGFREAKEETVKIQLELSFQITELNLQAQPLTPPEVTEQCKILISSNWEKITHSMKECTNLLAQLLITLTSLHEVPTLQ